MTLVAQTLATVIRAYQMFVSPWLPRVCRFAPSCSEYARVAILDHGLARGGWLAAGRILKCHPLHPGGYDPPPVPGRRA